MEYSKEFYKNSKNLCVGVITVNDGILKVEGSANAMSELSKMTTSGNTQIGTIGKYKVEVKNEKMAQMNDNIKSKLSRKYPMEQDIYKYLFFDNDEEKQIDPILAMRVAAFARDNKIVINILEGFRTYEKQVKMKKKYGKKAASPGNSWHEFGQAIDVGTVKGKNDSLWMKKLHKDDSTQNQTFFTKYGFFKPLTIGNKTDLKEDWHIQPIESIKDKDKKSYYKAYKGLDYK